MVDPRSRLEEMLGHLESLVMKESPSRDLGALEACAKEVEAIGGRLTNKAPQRLTGSEGHPHLLWTFGDPKAVKVLLIAHLDTVYGLGTTEQWPFTVSNGEATGPGVLDMKAGLVMGLHALGMIAEENGSEGLNGIQLLVTSDEEIGSPTGRPIVEDLARHAGAVLVLEPSADGKLKTARKGVVPYRIRFSGRSAHAGLEPEKGSNALLGMAEVAMWLPSLARPELGTTVTPTLASAGTGGNVVPDTAELNVDIRILDQDEGRRIAEALNSWKTTVPGVSCVVIPGHHAPPLSHVMSEALYERAQKVAAQMGIPALQEATVGGGSDGNYAADVGAPTLDGLGPVGSGAHALGREKIAVAELVPRTTFLAQLVRDLVISPLTKQGSGVGL